MSEPLGREAGARRQAAIDLVLRALAICDEVDSGLAAGLATALAMADVEVPAPPVRRSASHMDEPQRPPG